MAITIKDKAAIEKMRIAGRLTAEVLEMIGPHVKAGVTTEELDQICHDYIVNEQQAIPAPLNYKGFPKSVCTSVNDVICHGIPGSKKLKDGDIINIDISVIKDGYHGDSSITFFVGKPSILAKRLVDATRECLYVGIAQAKPGASIKDIGKAIQEHLKQYNYSIVHEYCGHGIGEGFHEEPQILHYYSHEQADVILKPGMCFTIEPMINAGKRFVKHLPDNWTVKTKDRSLSAQWEHTLLVTDSGVEILTLRKDEKPPEGLL